MKYADELRDLGFLEYSIGAGTRPTSWVFTLPTTVTARMITARYSAQEPCAQETDLARKNGELARRNEIASAQERGFQRAGNPAESVLGVTDERSEGEDQPPPSLDDQEMRDYVAEKRPELVAYFDAVLEKFKNHCTENNITFGTTDAERARCKNWFIDEHPPTTPPATVSTISPVDWKGRPLLDDDHEYCIDCDGKGRRQEFDERIGGARAVTCPTCSGTKITKRRSQIDLFEEVAL